MTGAAKAIAEGCGLRFIGSLVQQRQDSGLSEQQAVFEIVRLWTIIRKKTR